jgi:integrase/recombinase XerC
LDAARTDLLSLRQARLFAAEQAKRAGAMQTDSLDHFVGLWARFETFAFQGYGVENVGDVTIELVEAFVFARTDRGAAPPTATQHHRRSAIRTWWRILRGFALVQDDLTLDLELPPRTRASQRALSDEEVERCRWAALATTTETRIPAAWALAEAGALASEIAHVRIGDLELPSHVRLHGSPRLRERLVPLTPWGATQLARRVEHLEVTPALADRVAYEGMGSAASLRTSSASALHDVLRRAGLAGDPAVGLNSMRAWVGQTVLRDAGRIEDVAARLGMQSLDLAADLISYDWEAGAE